MNIFQDKPSNKSQSYLKDGNNEEEGYDSEEKSDEELS